MCIRDRAWLAALSRSMTANLENRPTRTARIARKHTTREIRRGDRSRMARLTVVLDGYFFFFVRTNVPPSFTAG